MYKIKAIIAILFNRPMSAPTILDRTALVKTLEIKAQGAALTATNFPKEAYPEAYGTFHGREWAFREAIIEVQNAV